MTGKTITLTPIAMTDENVCAPSHERARRLVSEADFLAYFADSAIAVPVSFEPDGVSNPQTVTAYGFGLDCWWIVGSVG